MITWIRRIAFTIAIIGLSLPRDVTAEQASGYFLSLQQKGQLIWHGSVQDSNGTRYDIHIVPGYEHPARERWQNIKQAGRDLHEYIEPRKYADIQEHSGVVLSGLSKTAFPSLRSRDQVGLGASISAEPSSWSTNECLAGGCLIPGP